MKKELKTEADVGALEEILLNQVLDKQNYGIVVSCEIHFDECEPTEEGYIVGKMEFFPWGADAFDTMENILRATVQPEYMSISVTVSNMI